jgi:hypothetical protein
MYTIFNPNNMEEKALRLLECIKDLPSDTSVEPKDCFSKIEVVEMLLEQLQDHLDEYRVEMGTWHAKQNYVGSDKQEFLDICKVFSLEAGDIENDILNPEL